MGLEVALRLSGYGFDPHFFKKLQIGGEDYYVQNDAFSYRFFPPENARNPGVLRMRAVKPPGTIRIFVFGESAAMGDPEPAYGPARYLEIQLRQKFPGTRFEVVNVAFTAINSHVIVPIARECAQREGDYWIIYMGNNEMVGPFGAATVFGRRAPPLPYVRLVTAIQATRTGQWFTALVRHFQHGGADRSSWGGMEMFINNQIPPDSPLRENVYRNFAQNLEDILKAGTRSGVKILLNTVGVNLRDCPPFAALPASTVSAADRAQAESLLKQAGALESTGDFSAAGNIYSQAAQLDSRDANLQFRWGKCCLAQNDLANARVHLQLACDDDALPFRTDSRLNALIQAAATKYQVSGVNFFDANDYLASQNPDALCGTETFFEHVHFDFLGSYELGSGVGATVGSNNAANDFTPGRLADQTGVRRPAWAIRLESGSRLEIDGQPPVGATLQRPAWQCRPRACVINRGFRICRPGWTPITPRQPARISNLKLPGNRMILICGKMTPCFCRPAAIFRIPLSSGSG